MLDRRMSQFEQFIILPGSDRPGQFRTRTRSITSNQDIEVTLQVRRRKRLDSLSVVHANGRFLTRTELEEEYGASPHDISVVLDFAEHFKLTVLEVDAAKRMVTLQGSPQAMLDAFQVQLSAYQNRDKVIRCRVGPIYIPAELKHIVTGVFGLDNRPQAHSHLRLANSSVQLSKPDAFDGNQLASIYGFPGGDGQGQTIALIELGGGFLNSDIHDFFDEIRLPRPQVNSVSVNGGNNTPILDSGADMEVALDIEVAGAVSPKAQIVVYFAPNDDASFLKAILAAVHDEINRPTIISISWGGAESTWTEQQMLAMNDAFQSAAAVGISVFCAAGDDGANDNVNDGKAHVDFPSSSPFATACGGTNLVVTNGARQESAWNAGNNSATGGGISGFFALPEYQAGLPMPANRGSDFKGRGVPDVSAVADPNTGYAVRVLGRWVVVGGTSAVAPLYAGLLARVNGLSEKPVGFINPTIYKTQNGFNDITEGNNSVDGIVGYVATVGWDAVTGFGSPSGASLSKVLSQGSTGPSDKPIG